MFIKLIIIIIIIYIILRSLFKIILIKVTENRIKMLQELKQRQIINYLKENETHLNTKRLRQLEQNRKENLLLSIIAKESRLSESKALKVKALAERVKIEQDLQKEKEATLMGQVPQPKKHYKKEILEKSSKDKEIFVVSTENPPVKTVKK